MSSDQVSTEYQGHWPGAPIRGGEDSGGGDPPRDAKDHGNLSLNLSAD
jgi:hypothetical protein